MNDEIYKSRGRVSTFVVKNIDDADRTLQLFKNFVPNKELPKISSSDRNISIQDDNSGIDITIEEKKYWFSPTEYRIKIEGYKHT